MTTHDPYRTIQIHIDLDTPHILNKFYRGPYADYEPDDDFCYTLLKRVGDFFDEMDIKATFFVITKDLQLHRFGELLKEFQNHGHEIAAHSHTHPYFNSKSSKEMIWEEIQTSYREISSFFQKPPKGFRSPGFFITDTMILMLIETGYKYDSSSFHAPLIGLLDLVGKILGAPTQYNRTPELKPITHQSFKEFSLPSCLGLPFYHNLNLSYPRPLNNLIGTIGARGKCSPYLFHLIEFADFKTDRNQLPQAIWKHPNLKKPLKQKLKFTRELLNRFKNSHSIMLSQDCI